MSKFLSHNVDSKAVEKRSTGRATEYSIQAVSASGFKQIEVTDHTDLRELPCISNLHEHLQKGKPTHYPLFSYARLLLSLQNDFSLTDLKAAFSEYPWYDEETTEYQVRYEMNRDFQPVSCNNENEKFTQYCIGRENCDYSIYASLPFKQEVYDSLDR
jgi:DNA primase large subunit